MGYPDGASVQTGFKVGLRIYFKNAFDFHLPKALICASERPLEAAHVAAPIQKLCDLYRLGSRPQKVNA